MSETENSKIAAAKIGGIQTNPNVLPAQSHHPSKSMLPGGERYTAFTKWRRRILALIALAILGYFAYLIVINMNAGGIVQAPSGPANTQVETDFKKNARPQYDSMKYLSDTSAGSAEVENIEVGRVVTTSNEITVGYSCEVTADVKFSNTSINSTSKMRMKYSYNAVLHSWDAGEISVEKSNYRPNSGPDMQKIQDDAINLLTAYDSSSGTEMNGATSSRSGDISKEGGETTLVLTKKGAGTNGADLVKSMTTRVEWSELEGWVASVTRVTASGEGLEDEAKKKEEEEKKKQEEAEKKQSTQATMELECSSGSLVQLTGTVNGTTLTTEMTRYVIDGTEVTTDKVVVSGDTSGMDSSSTYAINGYISLNGSQVEFYIVR